MNTHRTSCQVSVYNKEKRKKNESSIAPSHKAIWNTYSRRWAIASSVLLCLAISISFYSGKQKKASAETPQLAAEMTDRIVTPLGSRTEAILPDGTHVWLNSGTELSFMYDKRKGVREAVLDGEAYFEVMRDTLHPFVVETKELSVKVLGTKFNVKAYSAAMNRKMFPYCRGV